MSVPTAKELKKLAKACREAGIHYFKGEGFEFTLTGIAPEKVTAKSKNTTPAEQGEIESDILSQEDLLFWSSGGDINTQAQNQVQE